MANLEILFKNGQTVVIQLGTTQQGFEALEQLKQPSGSYLLSTPSDELLINTHEIAYVRLQKDRAFAEQKQRENEQHKREDEHKEYVTRKAFEQIQLDDEIRRLRSELEHLKQDIHHTTKG